MPRLGPHVYRSGDNPTRIDFTGKPCASEPFKVGASKWAPSSSGLRWCGPVATSDGDKEKRKTDRRETILASLELERCMNASCWSRESRSTDTAALVGSDEARGKARWGPKRQHVGVFRKDNENEQLVKPTPSYPVPSSRREVTSRSATTSPASSTTLPQELPAKKERFVVVHGACPYRGSENGAG